MTSCVLSPFHIAEITTYWMGSKNDLHFIVDTIHNIFFFRAYNKKVQIFVTK